MSSIRNILLAMVFLLSSLTTPIRAEQAPYAITISTPHDNVTVGDEVQVLITLRNISGQEISVTQGAPEISYKISMWDANGHPLKAKERHLAGSAHVMPLYPSQSAQDAVHANDIYDMSVPGRYTIQVQREIPVQLGGGVGVSNAITVTVTN